jgi:hypothetical protein
VTHRLDFIDLTEKLFCCAILLPEVVSTARLSISFERTIPMVLVKMAGMIIRLGFVV